MVALAGISVTGMAQSSEIALKSKVETNSFWSNWFVQANLGYDAFYSNQEKGKGFSKSPFKSFRSNIAPTVAVGKWFTPGIGLRTKLGGVWGRTINSEKASDNKMNYFHVQEQVMFNLSNMLCGYDEARLWNAIPYAGVGLLRNYSDNENCHTGTIGLLNTFRLNDRWALNLDLSFNISDDDFDGEQKSHKNYLTTPANGDRFFGVEVGVTFNLGKTKWKRPIEADPLISEISRLNDELVKAAKQNELQATQTASQPAPEPEVRYVEKVVEKVIPVKVYFDLNQTKKASAKELQLVKTLVTNFKDKSFKVTGYADSKTGTDAINQKLSLQRAEYVASEMVKMGVSKDNIEVGAGGGVSNWEPFDSNRCVVVEVK